MDNPYRYKITGETASRLAFPAQISDAALAEISFFEPKFIYVGTGGDIAFTPIDNPGTVVLLKNVPSSSVLPIIPLIIKATGTTASNIVALS